MMIRPRFLVAILAATLIVSACGSTDPTPPPVDPTLDAPASVGPSPQGSREPPPPRPSPSPVDPADAWAQVSSTIDRDGTVPLETALQAFALLIGPLPGVSPPDGSAPAISSGSAPIRWILGNWDGLTGAQRDAVAAALEPDVETAQGEWGPRLASSAMVPMTAATCDLGKESPRRAEIEGQAESASAAISERLGRTLRLPIVIRFVGNKPGLAAEAIPVDSACRPTAARPALCVVDVTDRGTGLIGFEIVDVIAHEVFHCFQYDLAKTAAEAGRVAPWLAEGSAAWVGEQISGGSTVGEQWWEDWVKYPWLPLFSRVYDGVGFFSHLQESGTDPWPILDKMLRSGAVDSVGAYTVASTAGSDHVIDAWGPGYIRHPTLRPDWSMGGAGFPEFVKTPVTGGVLANEDTLVAGTSPLGADAYKINVEADTFVIEELFAHPDAVHGLVHLPDGRQMRLEDAVGKPFCTKPGGCGCPSDSAGASHAWESTSPGEMLLGLTGHTDGVELQIEGWSNETTCAQAPEDFIPIEPCWCALGPPGPTNDDRPAAAARRQGRDQLTRQPSQG
jgi:hypothetical protein